VIRNRDTVIGVHPKAKPLSDVYAKSEKGIIARTRYRKSAKGKMANKRYRVSDKGQATADRYQARRKMGLLLLRQLENHHVHCCELEHVR
jgi:hypothetical protein